MLVQKQLTINNSQLSIDQGQFERLKVCILVPTYNNAKTLTPLLEELQKSGAYIIVVNDGSTDETQNILDGFAGIHSMAYFPNKGKGIALRRGFKTAVSRGYDYAISIDSDGQHFAKDIPAFLDCLQNNPGALIIGARNMDQSSVPGKSSFGHRFSNFWFRVETGIKLPDTQSGFRLYPLQRLQHMNFITRRFEFEIEVIVRAAWSGIPVTSVPVSVYYAPAGERISHFRPFADFTRISILNTLLVFISFLYIKPRDLLRRLFFKQKWKEVFIDEFFNPTQSIARKSSSVAFGIFMGILPIWGFQLVSAIFLAVLLRLNKGLVIVFANISIPPMIPLIVYASYRFGAFWMPTNAHVISLTKTLTLSAIRYNFKQYLAGSISLAITAGLVAGLITYILLHLFNRKNQAVV
jgi:glycosyltransferase involved in cell wall biosynthesis